VIDGVSQAMADLLIDFAVNVGLNGKHVFGRELIAALQRFVDALDAVGFRPIERQRIGDLSVVTRALAVARKPEGGSNAFGHLVEGM